MLNINGIDGGWVELQDMMGDDRAIVNAARVSYLGESKGDEQDKKLLFYLMKNKHTSPFEQVVFKFRIRAPLMVWWQVVRHRTASLNMQSGRYTAFAEDYEQDVYVPEQWRLQSVSNKQGSDGVMPDDEASYYDWELRDWYQTGFMLYHQALKEGMAKEQARLFLPGFAVFYTGVWTMDAHNLMHFLKLRMHPHAQWEIRQYANTIHDIFKEKLPWTAEAFEECQLNA